MSIAGGSSQREYERRHAKERAAMRSRLVWTIPIVLVVSIAGGVLTERFVGNLGALAAMLIAIVLGFELWGTSAHIISYRKGAEGERLTGRVLEKLAGYSILHDRKIPGSKANIDHIAIGPAGVFVIETKHYKGEVKTRGKDLLVGGHRRTPIVEQAWREVVAVQGVLAQHMSRLAIDCIPVLCILGSQVPWGVVQGVQLVGPRGLKNLIKKAPTKLSEQDITLLVEVAEATLQPA